MAIARHNVLSNIDWADIPSEITCDTDQLTNYITKGQTALKDSDAGMITFFHVDLKDLEYYTNYDQGEIYDYDSADVSWLGPHLKVYGDLQVLYWESKYTDETMWVDFCLC